MFNKKFKKAFSAVTMFATVVSLSGISMLAPLSVKADASIVDGDIIHSNATNSDGTPTVGSLDVYIVKIVGTKAFKRLILNPGIFQSYEHLKWSNLKTVSQATEDSYTTSSLVRVDGDSRVYALTPVPGGDTGAKSWVNVTADQFLNGAGSDPDSIYTINSADSSAYSAKSDITTVAQLQAFYADGTLPGGTVPVNGTLQVGLANDTPASNTFLRKNDASIAQSAADFLAVNFTAPSNGDVKVTNLQVNRSGISTDADLSNVYLYDGSNQIAQNTSFSSKVITFTNSDGLFTVPAGTTKEIHIKADIATGTANVSSIVLSLASATSVTSSATTVNGSFPITGNQMAVTTVTDLGDVNFTNLTTYPATADPGSIGKELWRLSATAESQDMLINKIKMTVVGTISATDLANLTLNVNSAEVATGTMNSSKEVVFDFGSSPYKITSGQTKIFTVNGDVVSGSGRTFKFTIRQVGDISVTDNGYNVSVAPKVSGAAFTLIDANAAGNGTSINNGNLSVQIATDSASGNVATGATGVSIAKFTYKANGEDVKINTVRYKVVESGAEAIDNVKVFFNGSQIGSTQAHATSGTTYPVTTSQIIGAGTTATIEIKADMTISGTAVTGGHTVVASLTGGTTDATGQASLASVATSAVSGRTLTASTGALTGAKNLALADATSALPSGVKGTSGTKIGSFVLTAGAGEGASISQIRLTDSVANLNAAGVATTANGAITNTTGISVSVGELAPFVVGESYYVSVDATPTVNYGTITVTAKASATGAGALTVTGSGVTGTIGANGGAGLHIFGSASGTDTLADTFQNLRLMQGTNQVGSTVSNLTDTAATNYDFTPSTAIQIAAGQQMVFDIYADAKSSATTLSVNSDMNGIINLALVTATGVSTGNSANYAPASPGDVLQKVYVAGAGSLTAAVSSDSPVSSQVVMGTTDTELARFKLTEATSAEDLSISQISVLDTAGGTLPYGTISNIKLWDTSSSSTTPLATVASLNGSNKAVFTSLNLTITKGQSKTLKVTADITTYPGGVSGSTHRLSIAATDITGTGVASGTSVTNANASTGTAGTMTAYRTKITIALASDTPSGASTASAGQTVAKFTVTNSANAGNYDAIIRSLNVNVNSSIVLGGGGINYITVYKNSISGGITASSTSANGNALTAIGYNTGATGNCTSGNQLTCTTGSQIAFSNVSSITDGAFADVTVAAGSSVTLIVTADTNGTTTASKSFSLGLSAANVTWTDGVTDPISAVDSLPITGKTLTY